MIFIFLLLLYWHSKCHKSLSAAFSIAKLFIPHNQNIWNRCELFETFSRNSVCSTYWRIWAKQKTVSFEIVLLMFTDMNKFVFHLLSGLFQGFLDFPLVFHHYGNSPPQNIKITKNCFRGFQLISITVWVFLYFLKTSSFM